MTRPTTMPKVQHWCPDRGGQPVTILLDGVPLWGAFAADAGEDGHVSYWECDEEGEWVTDEDGMPISREATGRVEIYRYPRNTLADCEHIP